jgi:hypothetical protein
MVEQATRVPTRKSAWRQHDTSYAERIASTSAVSVDDVDAVSDPPVGADGSAISAVAFTQRMVETHRDRRDSDPGDRDDIAMRDVPHRSEGAQPTVVLGQGVEQVSADRCSVDCSGQRDELAPPVGYDEGPSSD